MTDLYEKCHDCHLFVEPNDDTVPGTAGYVHLCGDDTEDEALDASHDARPSGMQATLAVWQSYGPPAMRARFEEATVTPHEVAQAHVTLDALRMLRDAVDSGEIEPWIEYATGPAELFTSYRQVIDQCAVPYTATVGHERPTDDYGTALA